LFVDVKGSIMMNKEAQDHELTETTTLESGRETSDDRGSSKDRQHGKRSMPAIRYRHRSVLCVGETCPSRSARSEMERLRVVIAELSMENLELKKGRLV
jgi:hypothetical protein